MGIKNAVPHTDSDGLFVFVLVANSGMNKCLRKQGINEKSIPGRGFIQMAKICDGDVLFHARQPAYVLYLVPPGAMVEPELATYAAQRQRTFIAELLPTKKHFGYIDALVKLVPGRISGIIAEQPLRSQFETQWQEVERQIVALKQALKKARRPRWFG